MNKTETGTSTESEPEFALTMTVTPEPLVWVLSGSCKVARYTCEGQPDKVLVNGVESDNAGMLVAMGQAAGKRVTFGKARKKKEA